MNELNSLTVDLFLYDLCEGLGRGQKQAEESRQQFWQRLYPTANGKKPVQDKETDAYFADYVELLAEKKYERFPDSTDGYYYPVQLGDTYALQVDSSGDPETTQSAAPPEAVQAISADIIENRIHQHHGELGESWLIWGQLNDPAQNTEATAKACYEALSSQQQLSWNRQPYRPGHP